MHDPLNVKLFLFSTFAIAFYRTNSCLEFRKYIQIRFA